MTSPTEYPRAILETLPTDRNVRFDEAEISRQTVIVEMRDGIRLATDVYLPPRRPLPAVVLRTPYGRRQLEKAFIGFARRGYAVVSQDCRGTGDSEPDQWQFMMFEREDGYDCVEWITTQDWYDGFIGSIGGSYCAGTQFGMATHPSHSATAFEVGGLGTTVHRSPPLHMFVNAYSKSTGKGVGVDPIGFEAMEPAMLDETLATGYFNEPLHRPLSARLLARYPELATLDPVAGETRLWEIYSTAAPADRASLVCAALGHPAVTFDSYAELGAVFGRQSPRASQVLPHTDTPGLLRSIGARSLVVASWYDWNLVESFATWKAIVDHAEPAVARDVRLVVTPSAHNMTGYHEGADTHPELNRVFRTEGIIDLLDAWYRVVADGSVDEWSPVTYYLMGANEWRSSDTWPPPDARPTTLYLQSSGGLDGDVAAPSQPDAYVYDPRDPTPTVGGNIVSYVYTPGSADVGVVQSRPDVLTFTTPVLEHDLDVVGPVEVVLFASTSAVDTDFSVRLSDVFPDGRAIQLASATIQARYRHPEGIPELVPPGEVVEYLIDVGPTANRFATGHRLRLDVSSADFPKYQRNANLGGRIGEPVPAEQRIFHDPEYPSRLTVSVVP